MSFGWGDDAYDQLKRIAKNNPDLHIEVTEYPRDEKEKPIKPEKSTGYDEFKEGREKERLEPDIQKSLFKWVRWCEEFHPEFLQVFAVPNGGYRPPKTAKLMKAEGARAGVADILCLVPKRGYHGACIELKRKYNKPSNEQHDFLVRSSSYGYYCCVCWSELAVKKVLLWYLEIEDENLLD